MNDFIECGKNEILKDRLYIKSKVIEYFDKKFKMFYDFSDNIHVDFLLWGDGMYDISLCLNPMSFMLFRLKSDFKENDLDNMFNSELDEIMSKHLINYIHYTHNKWNRVYLDGKNND